MILTSSLNAGAIDRAIGQATPSDEIHPVANANRLSVVNIGLNTFIGVKVVFGKFADAKALQLGHACPAES